MVDGDWIELKFRLEDGTDIGPYKYNQLMSVASLKEKIISQWPKDNENAPRMINEIKLINGGKILDNNMTLPEASPLLIGELHGIVTTMHIVLRPPIFHTRNDKLKKDSLVKNRCLCSIM